jgi:protein-serine/threonine kinase
VTSPPADSRRLETNAIPDAQLVSSPPAASPPLEEQPQTATQLPYHLPSESIPAQSPEPARSSLDVPYNPYGVLNSHALLQQNLAIHQAHSQYTALTIETPILTGGLHIRTDVAPQISTGSSIFIPESDFPLRQSASTASLPRRTPSIRAALAATHSSAGSISPGSAYSSPQLAAMADITPLPSPIALGSNPWKAVKIGSRSRNSSTASRPDALSVSKPGENGFGQASPPKKRTYHGLRPPTPDAYNTNTQAVKDNEAAGHARNRSLSEYVPEAVQVPKHRNVTAPGVASPPRPDVSLTQSNMHREEYLAVQRGIAAPSSRPPTPPRSTQSGWEGSGDEINVEDSSAPKVRQGELFTVSSLATQRLRRYRVIRQLGQGTFSKVMLALKESGTEDDRMDYDMHGTDVATVKRKQRKLVAVKVVQHGPAGGADAERVETSLSREIEILRSIDHPSLVHLKAFSNEERRSLLVLNFCPGGDMFEVASLKHDLLTPGLIRRIFSELVSAARYLHALYIVHRDIKLESMHRLSSTDCDGTPSLTSSRCPSKPSHLSSPRSIRLAIV